jgi:hypothetical protein
MSVIETINQATPATRTQSSLQEALKNERIFGLSTNRTSTNFKAFKGYYLLIEDPSGAYKPIILKEFGKEYDHDHPPWPVIHYENHASHSVFALPSHSAHDPTEKSTEEIPCEPLTIESAASGLISGSIASVMARNPVDNPAIASLAQRTADQIGKRIRDSDDKYPSKKDTRGQKINVNLIPAKAGYCENCNMKFDDYQKVSKS